MEIVSRSCVLACGRLRGPKLSRISSAILVLECKVLKLEIPEHRSLLFLYPRYPLARVPVPFPQFTPLLQPPSQLQQAFISVQGIGWHDGSRAFQCVACSIKYDVIVSSMWYDIPINNSDIIIYQLIVTKNRKVTMRKT